MDHVEELELLQALGNRAFNRYKVGVVCRVSSDWPVATVLCRVWGSCAATCAFAARRLPPSSSVVWNAGTASARKQAQRACHPGLRADPRSDALASKC